MDKIKEIFSKKKNENGHSVGYTVDAASKIHKYNMLLAVQKVDDWLRQHVFMKGTDKDCL